MKNNYDAVVIVMFLTLGNCALGQSAIVPPITSGPARVADKKKETQFPAAAQFANSKLTYKIIPAANATWCYDILADGRMLIHQPSIPGLPGKEGFKTKVAAQKVADLVIEKIKNGEMPPSMTKEEMQKTGAL